MDAHMHTGHLASWSGRGDGSGGRRPSLGARARFLDLPAPHLRPTSYLLPPSSTSHLPPPTQVRKLAVSTRRLPAFAEVSLQVSTNAQQYSTEAHHFTYYGGSHFDESSASPHTAPLALSSASPSAGPVAGETIIRLSGRNLAGGSQYVCRFGEQVVAANYTPASGQHHWRGPSGTGAHPAGEIGCVAPRTAAVGSVALQVSPNAQQFSHSLQYTYHAEAVIEAISPTVGPLLGGTLVRVSCSPTCLLAHLPT